jgi:hypothetical protein
MTAINQGDAYTDESLHDKIAHLESEVLEQCRINGMGAERELALLSKVERLERDNAKLEAALTSNESAYQRGYMDGRAKPLFTAAPPTQAPMTVDQIDDLAESGCFLRNIYEIVREVELAHGIKD